MLHVLCFLLGAAFGVVVTALMAANKYDERDGHP